MLILLIALVDCASTNRVRPYGPDRFMVTHSSVWGEAKARSAALRDANEYCKSRQLLMVAVDGNAPAGGSSTVSLIFSCEVTEASKRSSE